MTPEALSTCKLQLNDSLMIGTYGEGECRWGRNGWIDGKKGPLMREGAERGCLRREIVEGR